MSPCVHLKVRLWAHTDLPDEHRQAGMGKVGTRHRWGVIMIEIAPGPHGYSGVCVGIGVLLEGDMGLTSLLLSVSVFSAMLGRSPSTHCGFLWFLHS